MTKKDIVKTIAADADLTQLKVKEIVQHTFDEIIETLVRDGKIELRNFGVFKVTKRAARPARNPRTNARVNVPAKCVVTFKPGKEMAARIRELVDIPGKELEIDLGVVESAETTDGSASESLAATLMSSAPITPGPATVSPMDPTNSENMSTEAKTSLNQLTGE